MLVHIAIWGQAAGHESWKVRWGQCALRNGIAVAAERPNSSACILPQISVDTRGGGGSVPASLPSLFPTPPPPCSTYAPRARSKGVTTRECASFLQFTSSMLTHHSEPSLALLRTVSPQVQGSICR